jgi:hypothetical protein
MIATRSPPIGDDGEDERGGRNAALFPASAGPVLKLPAQQLLKSFSLRVASVNPMIKQRGLRLQNFGGSGGRWSCSRSFPSVAGWWPMDSTIRIHGFTDLRQAWSLLLVLPLQSDPLLEGQRPDR